MSYPPSPWSLRGRMHVSVWAVPVADLPALPPDLAGAVRVLRLGRRGLVGTAWVDYRPGGDLSYRELLCAVLTRTGWRPRVTITHIWVDSAASRDGGRALWGIPKDLADLTLPAAAPAPASSGVAASASAGAAGSGVPGVAGPASAGDARTADAGPAASALAGAEGSAVPGAARSSLAGAAGSASAGAAGSALAGAEESAVPGAAGSALAGAGAVTGAGTARASTAAGPIASAELPRGDGRPPRLPVTFRVVQALAGRPCTTPVRSTARYAPARVTWTVAPDGPLRFLAARRPLLSFVAGDFRMRFGTTTPRSPATPVSPSPTDPRPSAP